MSCHCCLCLCHCCLCYLGKYTVLHVDSHVQQVLVCVCMRLCFCLLKGHLGLVLAGSINRNEKSPPGLGIHWIQLPLIITAVRCSVSVQNLTRPWLQSHPSFAMDQVNLSERFLPCSFTKTKHLGIC